MRIKISELDWGGEALCEPFGPLDIDNAHVAHPKGGHASVWREEKPDCYSVYFYDAALEERCVGGYSEWYDLDGLTLLALLLEFTQEGNDETQ